MTAAKKSRNSRIVKAHAFGFSLETIAAKYGITKQRAHEIVKRAREALKESTET